VRKNLERGSAPAGRADGHIAVAGGIGPVRLTATIGSHAPRSASDRARPVDSRTVARSPAGRRALGERSNIRKARSSSSAASVRAAITPARLPRDWPHVVVSRASTTLGPALFTTSARRHGAKISLFEFGPLLRKLIRV